MGRPKRRAAHDTDDTDTALKRERQRKSPRKARLPARDRNISSERAPAWKAGEASSLVKAPGMWRYSTGDKPTRTWIEKNGVSVSAGETNGTSSHVFPAENGDGPISYAYHFLWAAGHHQAFIGSIYRQVLQNSEVEGLKG